LTLESAEILGLQALGWLAGEPDGLERFFQASGTDAAQLRQSAEDPALLGAVLAFLLLNEDLLRRFCEEGSVRPADIHAARHVLEGPCE
jgi:hypothetical protein